jgi:hypothetical protein
LRALRTAYHLRCIARQSGWCAYWRTADCRRTDRPSGRQPPPLLPELRCGGLCRASLCAQPMAASRRMMVDGARPASASPAQREPRHRRRIGGKRQHAARGAPGLKTPPVSVVDQPGESGAAGGGVAARGVRLLAQRCRNAGPSRPARCRPCLPSPMAASVRTLGCRPPACQTAAAPSAARILSENPFFVREYSFRPGTYLLGQVVEACEHEATR